MAIPHIRVTAQSRANGESAVAKAAYDSCSILRQSDQTFDYRKKKGLVHEEMIFASSDEIQNRGKFWRDTEKAEKRCDACVSREITFALPLELDQKSRTELAQDFSRAILTEYDFKAVDLCIHEPPPDRRKRNAKSEENPHAHLHIPTRNRNGKKLRQFNGPGGCNQKEIKKIRKLFEEITNKHLRKAGLKTQISTDTIEKQLETVETELTQVKTTIKTTPCKPSPLYICHYEDLLKICGKDATEDNINFRLACRLRATGHSQEETTSIINSFQHDPIYSQKITQEAFTSQKANKDIKKLEKWISNWKRLEQSSLIPEWKIKEGIEQCQKNQKHLMNLTNNASEETLNQ